MKVLHTIAPGGHGGSAYTVALLADLVGATPQLEHEVVVVGSPQGASWVRSFGLAPVTRVSRRPAWLRRTNGRGTAAVAGGDLVHAWEASSAAHMGGARLVTTMQMPVGPGGPAQLVGNGAVLLAPAEPVAAAWRAVGVGGGRCRTITPGIDPRRLRRDDRDAIRARWSIGPEDMAVGVLCDPPEGADVWNAATLQSLLECTERPVRIVVHDGGRHHVEAGPWTRTLGLDHLFVRDEDVAEPWRIAAGLDAAVVVGARPLDRPTTIGAGALPVLWAMAAGLPVIAERGCGAETLIEDGRSGLLVEPGSVDEVCWLLLHLHDEPVLRHMLGQAALAAVERDHRVESFGRQVLDLYLELA